MPPPVPGSRSQPPRRPAPNPFNDRTRAAAPNDELLAAVRSAPGPGRSMFDEPTRLGDMDALIDQTKRDEDALSGRDIPTNPDEYTSTDYPPKFLSAATELSPFSGGSGGFHDEDSATRLASVESVAKRHPPRHLPKPDDRTRNVDIRTDPRGDPSISDIDWDID